MANKNIRGEAFTTEQRNAVWQKAQPAPGKDNNFKLDPCGALMEWARYGEIIENGTGWEIDHIIPISRGGTDHIENLQALQWEHNRAKGDGPNDKRYCHKSWTRH